VSVVFSLVLLVVSAWLVPALWSATMTVIHPELSDFSRRSNRTALILIALFFVTSFGGSLAIALLEWRIWSRERAAKSPESRAARR